MNRSILMVAAAALLATASGCAGRETPIAIVAPADTGIVVSAEGDAKAAPDIAVLRMGVEANRSSMEEARSASAEAQRRIIAALKSHGVKEADMQTEQLSMHPQYDYTDKGRVLRGYTATNILTVTVRDIAKTGKIVDDAIEAGDNDARIDSLAFELSDPAAIRAAARTKAIKEARAKAEQLAQELGVELGEPIAVEEVGYSAPMPIYARAMKNEAMDSTPIQAGNVEATISIRVRWSIDAES